ncbi:MAG: DsrE family protein [Ginsengibacter sp.]
MNNSDEKYKVVIQLSDNDPSLQKATINQVNNILNALEDIQIEVVLHSLGIHFLLQDNHLKSHIEQLHGKGVMFLVCRNALNAQNLDQDTLLSFAEIIPSAVAHLIVRQAEGWSYLKIG